MANISKIDKKAEKEKQRAASERREIVKAGLSRRDMIKMGLLTSAGLFIPKNGLSARALNSADPATITQFYGLPSKTAAPRITRTFNFDRSNGNWTINGRSMDPECQEVRLRIQKNSVEHWIVNNSSGGWQHPAHIHFEEFQFLSINGSPPASSGLIQNGRKDVIRLEHNMQTKTFFRFRDFEGRYPFHCHNVVHEDHAMMLTWEIVPGDGDNKTNP